MAMKVCSKCKKELTLDCFHKRLNRPVGMVAVCKNCMKEYAKSRYLLNSKKIIEQSSNYYIKHREYKLSYSKEWHKLHGKNKWYDKELKKKYQLEHRKNINMATSNRRLSNAKYRVDGSMSDRIRKTLKGIKMGRQWESLVGYNREELMSHLEKQFDINMRWDNYGVYWHIDHIIPVSYFKYTKPEDGDFIKCWSLNNLRPLEAGENRRKHNKLLYIENA